MKKSLVLLFVFLGWSAAWADSIVNLTGGGMLIFATEPNTFAFNASGFSIDSPMTSGFQSLGTLCLDSGPCTMTQIQNHFQSSDSYLFSFLGSGSMNVNGNSVALFGDANWTATTYNSSFDPFSGFLVIQGQAAVTGFLGDGTDHIRFIPEALAWNYSAKFIGNPNTGAFFLDNILVSSAGPKAVSVPEPDNPTLFLVAVLGVFAIILSRKAGLRSIRIASK